MLRVDFFKFYFVFTTLEQQHRPLSIFNGGGDNKKELPQPLLNEKMGL